MYGFVGPLLAGPSPVIVAGIVLVGLGAAVTVCWILVRLVVPRRGVRDDEGQHNLRAADHTADEGSLPLWWEDATG